MAGVYTPQLSGLNGLGSGAGVFPAGVGLGGAAVSGLPVGGISGLAGATSGLGFGGAGISSLPVGGISGLAGATNTFGTIAANGLGVPVPIGSGSEGAVAEEEETTVGFFKKLPLPLLLLLLPAVLAVVVAVIVAVIRLFVFIFIFLFPGAGAGANKKKPEEEVPYPYPYESEYPESYAGPSYDSAKLRKRRSASPALTYEQIEKLTSVVYSALRSEECIQRILCEAGTMARSLPNAKKILKSVKNYVPESMKTSYDIFATEEKCNKFSCGPLSYKK